MDNFIEIIKAWTKSINPSENDRVIAESRMEICNMCDERKYLKMFNTFVCGLCNCPLTKKIYSNDKNSCKLNKWEK